MSSFTRSDEPGYLVQIEESMLIATTKRKLESKCYLAGWSPLSHRHTAPDVVYSYIPISLMTKIVKTTIQITIVTHVTPVTLSLPHADHDKEES